MHSFFVSKTFQKCVAKSERFVRFESERALTIRRFYGVVKPQKQRKYKENIKQNTNWNHTGNVLIFANMILGNARNTP